MRLAGAAERLLHRDHRLDRVVVRLEALHERVAVVGQVRGPASGGELLALLRGHREEGHRVGRVLEAEQLVLALRRGQAAHHRRVHPFAVLDLEQHLLVHARRVALAHEVVERRRRLLHVLPDLGRVEQRALEERGAHVLAPARGLPRDECGEDPTRDEEARPHARHRHVQEDRPHPPAGLLPLLAAARLHQRVVAGPVGEVMALRIARTRQVHEPGVARVQRLEPDAEPVGDAGTERLDEHVGVVDESQEGLAPGIGLEVDRHRAAGAVPHRVPAVRAERVATGWLHLHDVRALLGQEHHAEGTGDAPGEVEDLHTVECTHRPRSLAKPDARWVPRSRRGRTSARSSPSRDPIAWRSPPWRARCWAARPRSNPSGRSDTRPAARAQRRRG